MKYKPEDYSIVDSGFYGLADEDVDNYKEKLVRCRKIQQKRIADFKAQVSIFSIAKG